MTNELSTTLSEQLNLPSVAEALPADFNKARFVQNCIALVNESPQLAKVPRAQLVPGLLKAAYLGLDFFNKECYLIPYGSALNFQIDYKGIVKLCMKYSEKPISTIYANMVRKGDSFECGVRDNQPYINFKPEPFNNGEFVGAFAVCQFKDGTIKYETMNMQQLDTARHMSKAQDSLAWKKFTEEMYKKTVIRRLCKTITLDYSNWKQQELINGDMEVQAESKPVDNPFVIESEGEIVKAE